MMKDDASDIPNVPLAGKLSTAVESPLNGPGNEMEELGKKRRSGGVYV
jgi:hypothetical protein